MITKTMQIGSDPQVTLTAYIHEPSAELSNIDKRPAVLVFPGGGYRVCSDREGEPVALGYVAEGYHAFILRYTVGKKDVFRQAFKDAEAAMETIISHAGDWHVDTEKIAVTGFSAGGHLAAALGTMGKRRPAALILGYPCILKSTGAILGGDVPGLDGQVDGQTPPAFLFSTAADELVPIQNTLAFASAMAEAKRPFEAHIFQEGRHGLSVAKPHSSAGVRYMVDARVAAWFGMSAEWLKLQFGEFDYSQETNIPGVRTEFDRYGVDVALSELWKNPQCKAIVIGHLPMFADENAVQKALPYSLRVISNYSEDMLSQLLLEKLDVLLRGVPVKRND